MFVARAAICFERFKDVDPFGELRSSFVQAIPREGPILHFTTRYLHLIAGEQRVQRPRPRLPAAASAELAAASTSGSRRLTSTDFVSSANAAAIRASSAASGKR